MFLNICHPTDWLVVGQETSYAAGELSGNGEYMEDENLMMIYFSGEANVKSCQASQITLKLSQ